ncbi:MAG: hypothetical protein GY820_48620 [Gammaproteobacteria bacterium]|nr:hypothetical protein [Gammaproteobacteria bacterium]
MERIQIDDSKFKKGESLGLSSDIFWELIRFIISENKGIFHKLIRNSASSKQTGKRIKYYIQYGFDEGSHLLNFLRKLDIVSYFCLKEDMNVDSDEIE